jgi:protein gp37
VCRQCKAAGVPFYFKQWGDWHKRSHFPEAVWSQMREMATTRELPWGVTP